MGCIRAVESRSGGNGERMEAYWVTTQRLLQPSNEPMVRRPKLTEGLLKRPPFRFLHDIISEVTRRTGFAEGLFSGEELVASELKEKDSKLVYLSKIINCVGITLDANVPVRPVKILAGLEPEQTNIFLQMLAQAATADADKIQKAVSSCLAGEAMPPPIQGDNNWRQCTDSDHELSHPYKQVSERSVSSSQSVSSEKLKRYIYSPAAVVTELASRSKTSEPENRFCSDSNEVQVTHSAGAGSDQEPAEVENIATCLDERSNEAQTSSFEGEIYINQAPRPDDEHRTDLHPSVSINPPGVRSQLVRHGSSTNFNSTVLADKKNDVSQDTTREKKLSHETGRVLGQIKGSMTGKEPEMDAKRDELQRLREAIQALCQAISPLGKCIDYLQEDAEAMAKEYQFWIKEQQTEYPRLEQERKCTEDLLQIESTKLAELKDEIRKQECSNNAAKAEILRNDEAIIALLQAASTSKSSTLSD